MKIGDKIKVLSIKGYLKIIEINDIIIKAEANSSVIYNIPKNLNLIKNEKF